MFNKKLEFGIECFLPFFFLSPLDSYKLDSSLFLFNLSILLIQSFCLSAAEFVDLPFTFFPFLFEYLVFEFDV